MNQKDKKTLALKLKNRIKLIDGALIMDDTEDIFELAYCLRVLREENLKDFKSAETHIFDLLQKNKDNLQKTLDKLGFGDDDLS